MEKSKETAESIDIRIGVIGTGMIGSDHIRRIMEVIQGATVTAVADYKLDNAIKVAEQYGLTVFKTGEELIASNIVDAVLIASSDDSHAHYTKECIKARKKVLCEKPLATTVEDCVSIVTMEKELNQQFVQVGFMRRYDKGYNRLKQIIESRELGELLMIRSSHRNKTHAANHTTDMTIKNSGIHELDIIRWLTGLEYDEGMALLTRQNSTTNSNIRDPQLIITKSSNGITSEVEVNMNSGYGYDIQCEIICEKGTARLSDPQQVILKKDLFHGHEVYSDWSERFVDAYDKELQDWVQSVRDGKSTGATAWDGYAAQVAAQTLIESRNLGRFFKFRMIEKPGLYK